jgi:hypothetical protein
MSTWGSSPVQYVAVAQSSLSQAILTPTYGSNVTNGNMLLAAYTSLAPTGTPIPQFTIADTGNNKWYHVASKPAADSNPNHFSDGFFIATATSGGKPTVTITSSQAVYFNVSISEWATGGLPFQVAGATPAVSEQTSASPSVTTVNVGGASYPSLVVGVSQQSVNTAVTFGANTGWTQMDSAPFVLGSHPLVGFSLIYAPNITASSSTPTWTQTSSALVQGAGIAIALGAPSIAAITTYFMTYFGSTSLELQLGGSVDGINWYPLPCNYTPHSGSVVRDPSQPFLIGNTWFIGHTNANATATNTIDVASSTNLLDWTYVTSVNFSSIVGSGANRGVASPQILRDTNGEIYMFVAGSATWTPAFTNQQLIWVQPTDPVGLTTWGTPTVLTVSGTGSYNPYDPDPVITGGTYYMFYASFDPPTGYRMSVGTASTVTGTYTQQSTPDFTSPTFENPSLVQLGGSGNTWNWYLDQLGNGTYYAQSTTGPVGTYGAPTLIPNFSDGGNCQGASVIYLPAVTPTPNAAALLPAM